MTDAFDFLEGEQQRKKPGTKKKRQTLVAKVRELIRFTDKEPDTAPRFLPPKEEELRKEWEDRWREIQVEKLESDIAWNEVI